MIIAIDESGEPDEKNNPFVLGISIIIDEEKYRKDYEKISINVFGKFKVFKYSNDNPKPKLQENLIF
ncbi:hypothetical protein SJAV_00160 [Sulfurisphaera javensis]|uniref:DUF3800 domain-containing protein n=1 Tax=Sulfurisphaera javensis TaxID=2049879 RepID=A0AAT9GMF0_9CREN